MGTKADETNPPATDPPPTTDPLPTDPPSGSADAGGDDDDLADLVGEAVSTALEPLQPLLDRLAGDGGDVSGTRRSAADTESHVESIVERELAKFHKEKETGDRLAKVEAAVEKPPVKIGKIGRFFWGE